MTETRIPTQKRFVEKRDKIISKGFELMCNKGYHNELSSMEHLYSDIALLFKESEKNLSDKLYQFFWLQ